MTDDVTKDDSELSIIDYTDPMWMVYPTDRNEDLITVSAGRRTNITEPGITGPYPVVCLDMPPNLFANAMPSDVARTLADRLVLAADAADRFAPPPEEDPYRV